MSARRRDILFGFAGLVGGAAHAEDRVRGARARLGAALPARAKELGLAWPPRDVFIRAWKYGRDGESAGEVQSFIGDGRAPLALFQTHRLCARSGEPGPKRQEGDLQIPEGFYAITALNPRSTFHLSLRVDYPNEADRRRARRRGQTAPLGGDIMVHGNCVTIGCLPIEDGPIEELYLTVAEVFGRRPVPIHLFPRPLDDEGLRAALATLPTAGNDVIADETRALWGDLAVGFRRFEETRRVPKVVVGDDGRYVVR